jgi:hypothetical protein
VHTINNELCDGAPLALAPTRKHNERGLLANNSVGLGVRIEQVE